MINRGSLLEYLDVETLRKPSYDDKDKRKQEAH